MENVEGVKKKSKSKGSRCGKRYDFELKLRCVKLRLEEGIPASLLSKELGVSQDVIRRWVRAYLERGESGLRNRVIPVRSQRKLPWPVRKKIVEIKKRQPLFGVRRISHLLKRAFFLSASPEPVRRALKEESLIVTSKKKNKHNPSRPLFLSAQYRINYGSRIFLLYPWTPEEMEKVDQDILAEEIRGHKTRYWEDVAVGEELKPVVKGIFGLTDMIAYCVGVAPVAVEAHLQLSCLQGKKAPPQY
jgi:transposase-like protein